MSVYREWAIITRVSGSWFPRYHTYYDADWVNQKGDPLKSTIEEKHPQNIVCHQAFPRKLRRTCTPNTALCYSSAPLREVKISFARANLRLCVTAQTSCTYNFGYGTGDGTYIYFRKLGGFQGNNLKDLNRSQECNICVFWTLKATGTILRDEIYVLDIICDGLCVIACGDYVMDLADPCLWLSLEIGCEIKFS